MHGIHAHAGAKQAWKELHLTQDVGHETTRRRPKEEDFHTLLDDA